MGVKSIQRLALLLLHVPAVKHVFHTCSFWVKNTQYAFRLLVQRSLLSRVPWRLSKMVSTSGTARSALTRGLVPATSPCNKSQGEVPSRELAIFATKSSRRDQNLRLVPRIQTV